jgi:hypothetical protein
MTIGLLLLLSLGGLIVGSSGGYLVGKWRGRRQEQEDPHGKNKEIADLRTEISSLCRVRNSEAWFIEHAKNEIADYQRAVAKISAERDEFKRIAATHTFEIKPPKKQPTRQEVNVWNERQYSNHPRENLIAIAADLTKFAGKEIRVSILMTAQGGWREIFDKNGWKRKQGPTVLAGPPERVLAELETYLLDTSHPWVERIDSRKGTTLGFKDKHGRDLCWMEIDSPFIWNVDLWITEPVTEPAPPQVITVEVLRTETAVEVVERVVDHIVEKVVEVERIVEKPAAGPALLPEDELQQRIHTAVEDAVARRLAEVEVEAILKHVHGATNRVSS